MEEIDQNLARINTAVEAWKRKHTSATAAVSKPEIKFEKPKLSPADKTPVDGRENERIEAKQNLDGTSKEVEARALKDDDEQLEGDELQDASTGEEDAVPESQFVSISEVVLGNDRQPASTTDSSNDLREPSNARELTVLEPSIWSKFKRMIGLK